MIKKLLYIFSISFLLNFIWENLHFVLYNNYMGGEISRFILFRASLSDAVYISIAGVLILIFPYLRKNLWLVSLLLMLVSIYIEIWALGSSRWAYNDLMPIIPIINTGLSPTIQLGLTGFVTFKFLGLDR